MPWCRACRPCTGLPFNTIHGTFNHILFADSLWLMRITGKESLPTTVLPEGLTMEAVSEYWRDDHSWDGATQSLAEVDDRLMAMSDQYALLIGDLDDEKLHEHFTYHDTSGTPHERAVAPMLSHVFNHATHHRGQLSSAMFAALGTYFVTDFPAGPDFYE